MKVGTMREFYEENTVECASMLRTGSADLEQNSNGVFRHYMPMWGRAAGVRAAQTGISAEASLFRLTRPVARGLRGPWLGLVWPRRQRAHEGDREPHPVR